MGRFGNAAGVVTIIATFLTLYLAAWTRREGKATEARVRGDIKDVREAVTAVFGKAVRERASDDEEPPDPEERSPELEQPPVAEVDVGGKTLAVVAREDVPLRVLAALVTHWSEAGRQGRWTIRRLEWAARSEGRGNHPWYIAFRDDSRVYVVSFGGRGKKGPTIEEIDRGT